MQPGSRLSLLLLALGTKKAHLHYLPTRTCMFPKSVWGESAQGVVYKGFVPRRAGCWRSQTPWAGWVCLEAEE